MAWGDLQAYSRKTTKSGDLQGNFRVGEAANEGFSRTASELMSGGRRGSAGRNGMNRLRAGAVLLLEVSGVRVVVVKLHYCGHSNLSWRFAEKRSTTGETRGQNPSGAEARDSFLLLAARLKSCPYHKTVFEEFFSELLSRRSHQAINATSSGWLRGRVAGAGTLRGADVRSSTYVLF